MKIVREYGRSRFSRQTRSAGTNRTRPPPTLTGRDRALLRIDQVALADAVGGVAEEDVAGGA
ncbi:MAG: hypothetical protein OXI93_00765, partial [Bryobacterales bacterium]|nr:hypothetical protein [Bryobacterales bacterium]